MSFQVIILRLFLGLVLSGLIGMERENKNRPAGFRTHILVCVASVVVMLTSEFLFEKYRYISEVDIARLGAQVISGIGFLGAGTIIRQGANVKGLTTAATLWAVACVGLAIGIGFYTCAVAGSVIIYLTLILLRKLEKFLERKKDNSNIYIEVENTSDKIGEIIELLIKYNIEIIEMEFSENSHESRPTIKFTLKKLNPSLNDGILQELNHVCDVLPTGCT